APVRPLCWEGGLGGPWAGRRSHSHVNHLAVSSAYRQTIAFRTVCAVSGRIMLIAHADVLAARCTDSNALLILATSSSPSGRGCTGAREVIAEYLSALHYKFHAL